MAENEQPPIFAPVLYFPFVAESEAIDLLQLP